MLSEISTDRPGVLGEAGLGALQVWQSISEAQGRGRGKADLAIAFTDLVDFSNWALKAGTRPRSSCCATSASRSSRRSRRTAARS